MSSLPRTLVWLRWRLFRGGLASASRRDGLEWVSRLTAPLGIAFLVFGLGPVYLVAGVGSAFLGAHLAAGGAVPADGLVGGRVLLLVIVAFLLLKPFQAASSGTFPNPQRFLLLPVRPRSLHFGEYLAEMIDPWLLGLAILSVGLGGGLLFGGAPVAALRTFAAGVAAVSALAALALLAKVLLQLLLQDRRRGEAAMLIASLALVSLALIQLLIPEGPSPSESSPAEAPPSAPPSEASPPGPPRIPEGAEVRGEPAPALSPLWSLDVPGELYLRAVVGPRRFPGGGFLEVLLLGLLAAGFYELSSRSYQRLLRSAATGRGRAARGSSGVAFPRLPGLSVAVSAVAWSQLRSFTRTMVGKATLLQAPILTLVFGLLLRRWQLPEGWLVGREVLIFAVAASAALMNVLTPMVNQLAIDGSGLRLHCLSPLTRRELLRGKLAGWALLAAVVTAVDLAIALPIAAPSLGEALRALGLVVPAAASTFLLLAPLSVLLSLSLPKKVELSKLGSASQPHSVAGLGATFFLIVTSTLATGVAVAGLFFFGDHPLALLPGVAWTLLAALVAWLLQRFAEYLWIHRRENVLLVIAKG